MKPVKASIMLALILLGIIASGSLLARDGHKHSGTIASGSVVARGGHKHFGGFRHGRHVRLGVVVGVPVFWPGFYYPPAYYYYPPYYPPVVAAPFSPPVYIEQGDAQAAPEQSPAYWYYCAESNSYYPYVEQCLAGWQRVAPQPPPHP